MTKECLGPDCRILALQGVSGPCTVPVVIVTVTKLRLSLFAKCATYSDGSLMVVQRVSIADGLVMVIATRTN
jgi:hypothetical protein